ncbi:MAG: hypothetical protein HGB20_02310 [Chlorobiaceae bacterium]|nr:hypothetical protein [Chlorobiaceae bacterium]
MIPDLRYFLKMSFLQAVFILAPCIPVSLYAVTWASLSREEREDLLINSPGWIYACPGDTIRLKVMTVNRDFFFPMAGKPVDVSPAWNVAPSSGVQLDGQRNMIVIGRDVKDGTVFSVGATLREGVTVRENSVYVYTKEANPFIGNWKEEGGNIRELFIRPDRSFSVTVYPFEVYKDYWGHLTFDLKKKTIAFTIEGGNKKPADCDLSGFYRFRRDGGLELHGIYFGTIVPEDHRKQRYVFMK